MIPYAIEEILPMRQLKGNNKNNYASHSPIKNDLKNVIRGRTAVFIDAANLSKSVEAARYKVNYRKLRGYFEKICVLSYLGFYTVAFESKAHQDFLKALRAKRYSVITKALKIIWDHKKSSEVRKANFDVEIAVDALDKQEEFETLVLFSGDSDFDYLVRRLKEKGKRVLVISTRYHIAKELIGSCDKYLDVLKFKKDFLSPKG